MANTTEREIDWAEKIGKPAADSIVEMVAALELDYERLEELRDELKDLTDAEKDAAADLAAAIRAAEEAADSEEERAALDAAVKEAAEAAEDAADRLADFDRDELGELEAAARPCGNECVDADQARLMIEEDALSVQVRSGWVSPGEEMQAEDFEILLATGGPAVRIRGELDANGEPHRAWLEVQDWGKPWTQYFGIEKDTLLAYANCFTYGV